MEPKLWNFMKPFEVLEHRLVIDDSHLTDLSLSDDDDKFPDNNFRKLYQTFQEFLDQNHQY